MKKTTFTVLGICVAVGCFFWQPLQPSTLASSQLNPNPESLMEKIFERVDRIAEQNFDRLPIIQEKLTVLRLRARSNETKEIIDEVHRYIAYVIGNYEERELIELINFPEKQQKTEKQQTTATLGIHTIYQGDRKGLYNAPMLHLRVKPKVTGTPKNLILQTYINHGQCLEIPDANLPLDFTFISQDNGKTWKNIKQVMATNAMTLSHTADWSRIGNAGEYTYDTINKFMCGAFHLNVVYPKNRTIFDEGISLPLLSLAGFGYPFCQDITISADNASYEESTYCWDGEKK